MANDARGDGDVDDDDELLPVLYGSWGCSCSWRVRIALELKRVKHKKVAIMPPGWGEFC